MLNTRYYRYNIGIIINNVNIIYDMGYDREKQDFKRREKIIFLKTTRPCDKYCYDGFKTFDVI